MDVGADDGREPQVDRGEDVRSPRRLILNLDGIDLERRLHDRATIEKFIPHRGAMSLLDAVVWESKDYTEGVALVNVRPDSFWVQGHFPGRPMMPGVLMIEAAAQMACYLYNRRHPEPKVVAFLRIENAAFRQTVRPGDVLRILCREVKISTRRFVSDAQGIIGSDRIAFDARISGMRLTGDTFEA
jgi:3-hydroxyacyl-[acyl-carrier-protein] dehydratase